MNRNALFSQKKGQGLMMPSSILAGISAVFGLFLIGIFIFAFAIAGAEMGQAAATNTCAGYWNATSSVCQYNSTNTTDIGYTGEYAFDAINDTVQGASSFANFSPTLWIITAIGILIGLLLTFVGGFLLVRR